MSSPLENLEIAFDCLAETASASAIAVESAWPTEIEDKFARAVLVPAGGNVIESLRATWIVAMGRMYAPSSVLARVVLEAGIRCRWASIAPDGWKRMLRYRANEDIKWAKEALNDPSVADIAQRSLELRERFLSENPCTDPPKGLPELLRELMEMDGSPSDGGRRILASITLYGHFYRLQSGQVHGLQGGEVNAGAVQHAALSLYVGVKIFHLALCQCCGNDSNPQSELAIHHLDACLERVGALTS